MLSHSGPPAHHRRSTPLPRRGKINDTTHSTPQLTGQALVRNDSLLPIFDVALVGVDANGNDVKDGRHELPYLPGTTARNANSHGGDLQKDSLKRASYVCFTDAAGAKWRRSGAGVLEEVNLEEVREYTYLTDKAEAG